MKNYLKFIVAVFGITVAMFSTSGVKAGTKKGIGTEVTCVSYGFCGTTSDGKNIDGHI